MPFYGGTNDLAAKPETYVYPTGPSNYVLTGGQEVILTAGSDLDVAAPSSGNRGLPWSKIIDGAVKFFNSFRPNTLQDVKTVNLPANYGNRTSVANFSFRGREFTGIGSYPGPVPVATRPTYNNLIPIVWGLRDIDPAALSQPGELVRVPVAQDNSLSFTPGGVASVSETLL